MSAKNPIPRPSLYSVDRRYRPPRGRRCGPILTAEEMSWARHAVAETIIRRTASGEPVPRELRIVLARLDDLLVIGSVVGTVFGAGSVKSEELLTVAEVAVLLGYSPEYVRRIAERLGGMKSGGRWLFPRHTVIEHLNGKEAS